MDEASHRHQVDAVGDAAHHEHRQGQREAWEAGRGHHGGSSDDRGKKDSGCKPRLLHRPRREQCPQRDSQGPRSDQCPVTGSSGAKHAFGKEDLCDVVHRRERHHPSQDQDHEAEDRVVPDELEPPAGLMLSVLA
jgi:hypothetical protein